MCSNKKNLHICHWLGRAVMWSRIILLAPIGMMRGNWDLTPFTRGHLAKQKGQYLNPSFSFQITHSLGVKVIQWVPTVAAHWNHLGLHKALMPLSWAPRSWCHWVWLRLRPARAPKRCHCEKLRPTGTEWPHLPSPQCRQRVKAQPLRQDIYQ